jgi:hypothetical protein
VPDRLGRLRGALAPWRGVLAGAGVSGAGLLVALSTFGLTRALGLVLALLGLALAWTARQRMRWGRGGGGPGVVQVDERRLLYWGPLTGGVIDMDDLRRLDLDPQDPAAGKPARWILWGPGGQRVEVPVAAAGAERLLDLFAALPGLPVERLLAARMAEGDAPVTVWRRDAHLGVVR